MIEIYGSDNHLKCRIEPAENSQQDKTLGGDNLLSLSFTHHSFVQLDVNDWCEFEGERYWLQERYLPTQKSEREWDYDLKFCGVESLIKRLLILKNPDGENEAVFTLTAPASEHVRLIVDCINAGMGTSDWKTGSVVATENLTVDYSGTFCDEGLRKVAEAAKTEWWVEGQTVNVCRCEHGEELTLRYPESITQLERDTADGVKFYTRLFPMGSMRNIDRAKYGAMRLQLPGGQKYVDMNVEKYGIFHHYEEAAFSHIYPRRIGTVSSVRESSVKDNEGKPFKIYWFKDSALPFNPNDYEIGGLVKHVVFQSGELDGRDFEVNYHADTQEFEIITTWPYDDEMQMPGGHLIPKTGDKYILWNIRMPDEYYGLAEQEYLEAVKAFNAEHCIDASVYKCPTHHVWIERNKVQLYVGLKIRLESRQYFPETGFRHSRITRITRNVVLPSQMDIEISDATSVGNMTRLTDSINEVKSYAKEALGALPDMIRSGDATRPTDTNLFSARRSQKEFLSKKAEDVATKLITFLEGIGLGSDGRFLIDENGVALLSRILVGNFVKGSSGAGIYADEQGNCHIEGDYVHVRKQLTAEEVQLMKSTHINGRVINSPGSFTISRVEKTDGGWRCYFTQQDGEGRMVSNTMGMDDYAYCETFNLVNQQGRLSNHYWHRRVFGLGVDYVDICGNADADDYASGSGEPKVGDEVSTLGNRTNPARQHAIIQAAAGTGSPYYRMYVGINSFSMPKPKIQMSPTEGSWWMVTDEHGNDMPMEEYIASLKSQVNAVQQQADRQLVIWFGDAVPTSSTEPANEWTDEAAKEIHLHDIYYNRSYAETAGGRAYSFEKDTDGTYFWKEITDADVLKSLEAAQRAQDTADGKRRVFVREQPVPPYDKGDQWSNATYSNKYQNDLLVCVKSRGMDDEFDIDDWVSAQQYTTRQFEASLKVDGRRIDAVIHDLSSGLERVGFHLDGKNSTFDVIADRFKVVTTTGKVSFFTEGGKLNADLIDARKIVAEGIQAGDIDAKNATIKNLTVDGDSTFKGSLDGTRGTFKSLECINSSKDVLGGIFFREYGKFAVMAMKGDLGMFDYVQGGFRRRRSRFYAADVWCHGQFGHYAKICAVIKDEFMYVHHGGHIDTKGVEIMLPKVTLKQGDQNVTCYKIPLFSPGEEGGDCGAVTDADNPALQPGLSDYYLEFPYGAPIDVVIFNCTSERYYMFSGMGYGKSWKVINGKDHTGSGQITVRIFDHGGVRELYGGVVSDYMYVNPLWLTPSKGKDFAGAGVFYSDGFDFNW